MSTLFFIGNGFDLNCGMKTQYVDVYEWYVKEKSTTENIKKFKNNIADNLKNWGDFEIAMAKYAECLECEEDFLECVRDFAEYMENYLIKESQNFKKKMLNDQIHNSVIKELIESMSSFYDGISHNVDAIMKSRNAGIINNIDVVSFNYTDVFDEMLIEYINQHGLRHRDIIHIHGLLHDDPVFGVDNIEQIKTKYTFSRKGKRSFIKPIFNAEYDEYRVQQVEDKIYNADTICVYGMSLGESDLSWRNAIIDWLKEDDRHHLFVYRYSVSNVNYRTVGEKMDIEDDEKVKLFAEWGIDANDVIFEQVHIPCGKNIFNIQNVIETINKENYERMTRELQKKVMNGKEVIEQHLQDNLVVQ